MADGFTKIDNDRIERAHEIGPGTFLVYAAIVRHANERRRAWPGIDRLAAMTGLCHRSVRYAITKLEASGWLIVEREPGRANIYVLPPIESKVADCQPPETSKAMDCQGVRQPVAAGEAMGCLGGLQPVAPEVDLLNKTHKQDQLKKTKRGCAAEVVFPSELDTDSFKEAWGRWLKYRRGRRLTCTVETLEGQLRKLATLGPTMAIAEIQNSIDNGWQSVVYKVGVNGNGKNNRRGFPVGPGQCAAGTTKAVGVF